MKIIVLFCLLSACLFSCRETLEENNPKRTQLVFKPKFDGLEAFLNYQDKIESKKDLQKLPSLLFTHKSGSTLQNTVFLDKNGEILKAEQEHIFTDGKKTVLTFYFLKEVLSMVQIAEENMRLSTSRIEQTRVFYDANQRPIAAYKRLRYGYNNKAFEQIKLSVAKHQLIEKNLRMLSEMQNQEGEFTLYFQGFDEAFNKNFIQFGNKAYSTNLAYAPDDSIISGLEKNPNAALGQAYIVQHQLIQDASGLQYQVLLGIKKYNATN